MLALATGLAGFPYDAHMPLKGSARSQSCGSSLGMVLSLDDAGCIAAIGLRSHACAIGQAAAAIFANAAAGMDRQAIGAALGEIADWLAGKGAMPDWPGLSAIAAARDYPARHGAIMLAWKAALDALPTA